MHIYIYIYIYIHTYKYIYTCIHTAWANTNLARAVWVPSHIDVPLTYLPQARPHRPKMLDQKDQVSQVRIYVCVFVFVCVCILLCKILMYA